MPRKKKDASEAKPTATRKRKTSTASPEKTTAKKPSSKPGARKTTVVKKETAAPKALKAPKAKKEKTAKESIGSTPRHLPRKGETQMVAFVRDPNCIFTYWEVTPESAEEVRRQLMEEYPKSFMVLRLLRQNANGQMEVVQELRVKPGEMNRYVALQGEPGSFVIEIAQKAPSGKTIVYARSQTLVTGGQAGSPASASMPDYLGVPGEDIPKAFLDYFEEGDVTHVLSHPAGVISSAEAFRLEILRQKNKQDRYAASRLR